MFILITGWYGVKHITKGVIRLVWDCFTFGVISYLFLIIFTDKSFVIKECIISGMFLNNWFVVAYVMLLLIVPIIETSLKQATPKQLQQWLISLTIFNIFFGFILGNVILNGYNVIQFVYLYYLARFMKISQVNKYIEWITRYGLFLYVFFSIFLAVLFISASTNGITFKSLRWFAYNNPLLMMSSIGLFMWISQLSFKSKYVNLIASGVFGTFILHTTPYVIPFRNSITRDIFTQYGYVGVIFEAILLFLILCMVSLPLHTINQLAINFVLKYGITKFKFRFKIINDYNAK